ncbi:phospholipase A and acyltransferase 3-like isoform X3 [Gopherus evgoodei]|uniref:phospholipase A and acyltransferase 3-like isoform X3 n=1 Tax=Gopherus evgoodei TaxID=1825980 RepID=UPI0011CF661E|nr:phospholipase A and acyltransferase 3-like isoform X3 [Gopherus evgoodei]
MEPIERQILPSPLCTLGQSEREALPGVCVTLAPLGVFPYSSEIWGRQQPAWTIQSRDLPPRCFCSELWLCAVCLGDLKACRRRDEKKPENRGPRHLENISCHCDIPGAGFASLMSTLTNKAMVKKERLLDVVGRHRYRVNNKHDRKFPPLPAGKIVQAAEQLVGQEMLYRVTSENCEHFVTELRYGVAKSDQVRDVLVGVSVAGLGLAALGLLGVAVQRRRRQNQ